MNESATETRSEKKSPSYACEKLIIKYRNTAHKLAHALIRRWGARIGMEDLKSAADLALCEAAKRFRKNKGAQFTTFLFYYVKSELIKEIRRSMQDNMKVSPQEGEESFLCEEARERIEENEVAALAVCPETQYRARELQNGCRTALKLLTSFERDVIREVYVNEYKVAVAARRLGYSRGHVSEIRRRALYKMRDTLVDFKEAA